MSTHASPDSVRGWRRLWQPRSPAFWLALGFNVGSSVLVLAYHTLALQGAWGGIVLGVALANSLLGMWWLGRLWRGTGACVGREHSG